AASGAAGAAGTVAAPHAASSSTPAISKMGDGRMFNDPLMEAPEYHRPARVLSRRAQKRAPACHGRPEWVPSGAKRRIPATRAATAACAATWLALRLRSGES